MRAKFIFESVHFERGKDPKDAMIIGQEAKLKQWLKDTHGVMGMKNDDFYNQLALQYAVMDNRLDFVRYLILDKKVEIDDSIINLAFKNKVDDEIRLLLITKGDSKSMDYLKSKIKEAGKLGDKL